MGYDDPAVKFLSMKAHGVRSEEGTDMQNLRLPSEK